MAKAVDQNQQMAGAGSLGSIPITHPLMFLLAAALLWVLSYANLAGFAAAAIAALPLLFALVGWKVALLLAPCWPL